MSQKILLIDDSAMLRRIAASVLRAQPARYEVLAATRATEGFAQACGTGVQLIFADHRIAGAADLDFCRRLLSEPRTAKIPVVLLLGRDVRTPENNALPANVVDVLRKPFAPEQLAGMVNVISGLIKTGLSLEEIRVRLHPSMPVGEEIDEKTVEAVEPPEPDVVGTPTASAAHQTVQRRPLEANPTVELFGSSKLIKAASLSSVFRNVARDRSTGVLRFHRQGSSTTDVYVEGGRLLAVSTRDARRYSEGAAEVLSAKVSPATLEEAVNEQARSGVPFLLTLGTRGLLSKASAIALLQRFGKKQFARLWCLRPKAVEFEFEPVETLPPFALRLEAVSEPMDQWLLDSLRLLKSEDVATDIRHEGCVGTPCLLGSENGLLKALDLNETEQKFVQKATGRSDLPTIAKAVGITTETAYLLLFRFRCLEILDYRPAPAPFVVTPRTNLRRVLPLPR